MSKCYYNYMNIASARSRNICIYQTLHIHRDFQRESRAACQTKSHKQPLYMNSCSEQEQGSVNDSPTRTVAGFVMGNLEMLSWWFYVIYGCLPEGGKCQTVNDQCWCGTSDTGFIFHSVCQHTCLSTCQLPPYYLLGFLSQSVCLRFWLPVSLYVGGSFCLSVCLCLSLSINISLWPF